MKLMESDELKAMPLTGCAYVEKSNPNREELLVAYKWVKGEHEKKQRGELSEWRQDDWIVDTSCGTVCCVAGKVALESGYERLGMQRWRLRLIDGLEEDLGDADMVDQPTSYFEDALNPGKKMTAAGVARRVLGLGSDDSEDLFRATNTFFDVRRVITRLIGEDPENLI